MTTWKKAVAVAAIILLPSAFADGAKGGATALVGSRPVIAGAPAKGMSCGACKNVGGTAVADIGKGRSAVVLVGKDACPTCKTVLGVEGHGKAKRDAAKHSCGEAGAGCCRS
jgi:hypothetical protein